MRANRDKLKIHTRLLGCFLGGGLSGALAFKFMSYAATVPFAVLLAALAIVPVFDDLRQTLRSTRQRPGA